MAEHDERREDSIALSRQVIADLERHLREEALKNKADIEYKKTNDAHVRAIYASLQMASSKIDVLQAWVKDSSDVVREVRDLLTTFRVSRRFWRFIKDVGPYCVIWYAWFKGWLSR